MQERDSEEVKQSNSNVEQEEEIKDDEENLFEQVQMEAGDRACLVSSEIFGVRPCISQTAPYGSLLRRS